MDGTIWIVVPAYNEEKHIIGVIEDLQSNGYHHIVVIDDGSKDNTADASRQAGAIVLTHVINRGQGASLKTGIDFALLHDADYIITFDSDGQHQAKDIATLLSPLEKDEADIVLGSRFLHGAASSVGSTMGSTMESINPPIPLSRQILLKGSIFVIWIFYGLKMTDAHNGFRALSRRAAERITIKSNRMEHASEIINEIKRNNLRYLEKPVTIRYNDPRHIHGAGSYFGAIRIFLKMVLHKLMR